MPLPDARVILAAKAYAHQIEVGRSPDQARNYLAESFGLTSSQVRSAIRQAQRAMRVGEVLATLQLEDTIRKALEGQRAPARTVGVRVEVEQWQTDPPQGKPWRTNTLYVEVSWDATTQYVRDLVDTWMNTRPDGAYGVRSTVVNFVGPSLWPGGTVGV